VNWRELSNAPSPGTHLGNLQDLVDGGVHERVFGEGKDAFSIILFREGELVRAYANRCPHFGIPLNVQPEKFYILSDRKIMCATHCAVFSISDGQCTDGPVKGDHLMIIEIVIVDDGKILIAAPTQ
jgi:nitrite reductase/ring-hydroxylating ferredoxin subunit